MAQSSSAQKDPSMEEILASIRKIIEEGDGVPARKAQDIYDAAPIGPAANDVTRSLATLDADAAALLRQPAVQPELRASLPADAEPPRYEAPRYEPAAFQALDAAVAEEHHDLALDDFELDLEDEAETIGAVEFSHRPAVMPSIISPAAGRQVAASFSELVDALAANRQRSLDDIAGEVLRPMLQDWLDNNLPTLVERLVREEIERVARGG